MAKGKKCPVCGSFTVFDGVCRNPFKSDICAKAFLKLEEEVE